MPETLARIFYQVRDSWNRLPRQAKIVIPIVAIVILGALIVLSFWSGSEEDVTLFSNLSNKDVGLIEAELARMNYAYQIRDGAILVPAGTESKVRMALAMKNLPDDSDAYAIFDQSNLGDTFLDYDRKYQQMTEVKIQSAIESLDAVQFAYVNITPMIDSPFAIDKNPAKAVITLRLRPGRALQPMQVQGIKQLVASSVKGLSPEDVNVIDALQGIPLNATSPASETDRKIDGALKRLEYEEKIASKKEQKIKESLAQLVGNEHDVQAIVHVETDFDNKTREEIIYNPNELSPEEIPFESQTRVNEKVKGPANTGLPPGTASNVTTSAAIDLNSKDLEVERDSTEISNLVSQSTLKTESAPGDIKRLTATVIIDYKKAFQNGELQYVDWTPDEKLQLEQTVKNAVGFDAQRGDNVNVMTVQFDRTAQQKIEEQLAAAERQERFKEVAKAVSVVAVGLIIFLLLRSVFHTLRIGDRIPLEDGAESLPSGTTRETESPAEVSGERLTALQGESKPATSWEWTGGESLAAPDLQEANQLQEEAMHFVQKDPEAVALVIRNWLLETEENSRALPKSEIG